MIFIIKIVFESPILADFKDQAWFLFTKYNFCKYLTNFDPTKLKLNNLTDTALVHMATIYSWMPICHNVLKFFLMKVFYFSAPAFFLTFSHLNTLRSLLNKPYCLTKYFSFFIIFFLLEKYCYWRVLLNKNSRKSPVLYIGFFFETFHSALITWPTSLIILQKTSTLLAYLSLLI